MSARVTVVDYGVGNLSSVKRAFEAIGAETTITSDANIIGNAERLVLPGVGAFGDCMRELKERALHQPVLDFIPNGRPFLGICVGMQILLSVSEEFGTHTGLGIIPGSVKKIPGHGASGEPHNLPYIGWAPLKAPQGISWENTLLANLPEDPSVYFVHSFAAQPENRESVLAVYDYNGVRVTAAIRQDHITGMQFHPEKSGAVGLRILRNFCAQG